jgi:hypothetical protein
VSFFSFQDIVTSVTGILLLVVLMFVVELITRSQDAGSDPDGSPEASPQSAELRTAQRELEALKRQLAVLEAELARLAAGRLVTTGDLEGLRSRVAQLEEIRRREASEAARLQRERENDQAQLRRLGEEVAQAQRRVVAAQAQSRIATEVTLLGGSPDAKQPVLIELASDAWRAFQIDAGRRVAKRLQTFDGQGRAAALSLWLGARRADREFCVLLVRPAAAADFLAARRAVAAAGFESGWDVWPDHRRLVPGDAREVPTP